MSVSEERHLAILTELPFVVPFEERVKVRQPSLGGYGICFMLSAGLKIPMICELKRRLKVVII